MPHAEGIGSHRVEGVEKRDPDEAGILDPEDQEQLHGGPSMSIAGAMPEDSTMNNWNTASPQTDATKPETMPHGKSTPLPGETEDRDPV